MAIYLHTQFLILLFNTEQRVVWQYTYTPSLCVSVGARLRQPDVHKGIKYPHVMLLHTPCCQSFTLHLLGLLLDIDSSTGASDINKNRDQFVQDVI